jgi:hypothetical protein
MSITMSRVVAGANKATFTIKPIRELVTRYVGDGHGWIDPFAGDSTLCEWRNDINPERGDNTTNHLDSLDFVNSVLSEERDLFRGVILDPPYSYRQVSEHYKSVGRHVTSLDTSNNFYNRVMNAVCDFVEAGGHAISCGWNSNGFGRRRGFEIVEVLLVAHGQHHNDTIITVEVKK